MDVFLWLGLPAALIASYYALREEFEEHAISYREKWARLKDAWGR